MSSKHQPLMMPVRQNENRPSSQPTRLPAVNPLACSIFLGVQPRLGHPVRRLNPLIEGTRNVGHVQDESLMDHSVSSNNLGHPTQKKKHVTTCRMNCQAANLVVHRPEQLLLHRDTVMAGKYGVKSVLSDPNHPKVDSGNCGQDAHLALEMPTLEVCIS